MKEQSVMPFNNIAVSIITNCIENSPCVLT